MAAPNLSEIVTTTLRNRSKKIADNVTDNCALLTKLKSKGKIKPFSGGTEITHELSYAENQTYKRYSGYEILDISPSEVLSAATYAIKQAAVAVTISGLEQLQNSGMEQMIDLLESRIDVAEATMKNNLSSDLYSDGTASNGKQITGLQAQISTSPTTGTVGGINRANYTFWRNQMESGAISGTITDAKRELLYAGMRSLIMKTTRNNDKVDLIAADNVFYGLFWSQFQDRQRFTKPGSAMAAAGFDPLAFGNAEVVLDGGLDGDAPANRAYFLNTDFIQWRPHSKRNMVPLENRTSTNQDAMVQLLLWAGNLTMSNGQLQGVFNGS